MPRSSVYKQKNLSAMLVAYIPLVVLKAVYIAHWFSIDNY
jgi:hypothetical protein